MARKGPLAAAVVLALFVFVLQSVPGRSAGPPKGLGGFASIVETAGLDSLDARQGSVDPTAAQLAAVEGLGARATWNQFGTPQSLIRDGGHLATDVAGANAADAARTWVNQNRSLFRLHSTDNLALFNDARLEGSDGQAVTLRQTFGGIGAVEGGLITVGVEGSPGTGWDVAYASSTATGGSGLAAPAALSPTDAWLRAAADVGRATDPASIGTVKQDREWTVFTVAGFAMPQRAREVAVPTPNNGVRPAWETILLDDGGGGATAYQHFVDAATGSVLVRKNLVQHSHPLGAAFSGTMPPQDAACDSDKGPWIVAPGERIGAVTVTAEAALTTNDVVLHLVRNGTIVATQDTLFSPEVLLWEPSTGDLGEGTYHVRVCDFSDGDGWNSPRDYSGTIVFSPQGTSAVAPYPPKWKVFPAYPRLGGQTHPWNYPNTDTREVWCWESTALDGTPIPGCDRAVKNAASPVPWDFDARTNTPTFTTRGNNASTSESWFSPLSPGPTGFRPVTLSREYIYDWGNQWHTTECLPAFTPGVTQDVSAAAANLFAMHNRMHDWSYFLGFTERKWNAQDSNFGSPTAAGDPLLGDVQAGAGDGGFPSYTGRDNANMIALPDGVPPITNMYLWQPVAGSFYAPCVDGDFDMAVIGHEFGHLTENRMIGKGGTRSGHHAGAMGESFGDFNAVEYLAEYGFAPVSGEDPFAVGAYVTANHERAIRNYNMSSPQAGAFPEPGVAPEINPLNFGDMGYDIVGQQVHANGEIWSATNFTIRKALIQKYGSGTSQQQAACADGQVAVDQCPGNRRWIQIVFDAMLLMPTNPSMLSARDAYLAADQMRFGGANQAELWLAFAQRGFGELAASTNNSPDQASSSYDATIPATDPTPNFESKVHTNEATVTFAASDEVGGAAVPARFYVGHYEGRASPIADTDPGTAAPADPAAAGNNLDNQARFVPGTYEFVVQANGYGAKRFALTLAAGETRNVNLTMAKNVASKSQGATASGDGTNQGRLIDDTEATNWDDPSGGPAVNVANPAVTVNLAGTAPVTIDRVNVSAMLEPVSTVTGPSSENRFTALRQFAIEASTNGTTFTRVFTSGENAFPGFNPRPVGPEIILRTFDIPNTPATHLRIVVLDNQCTGNPNFQGEQDLDPVNPTECRVGAPPAVAERASEVHIAELQAFGAPPAPAADLGVDKQGPATAQRGQNFDYVIVVTNGGPDSASGVTLTDNLPKNAGYGAVLTDQGSCVLKPAKRLVTCNLGTMPPGDTATVRITVKPTSQGTITNTASVTASSPPDPNTANNSDSVSTSVT